jgi:hypothetical protein
LNKAIHSRLINSLADNITGFSLREFVEVVDADFNHHSSPLRCFCLRVYLVLSRTVRTRN